MASASVAASDKNELSEGSVEWLEPIGFLIDLALRMGMILDEPLASIWTQRIPTNHNDTHSKKFNVIFSPDDQLEEDESKCCATSHSASSSRCLSDPLSASLLSFMFPARGGVMMDVTALIALVAEVTHIRWCQFATNGKFRRCKSGQRKIKAKRAIVDFPIAQHKLNTSASASSDHPQVTPGAISSLMWQVEAESLNPALLPITRCLSSFDSVFLSLSAFSSFLCIVHQLGGPNERRRTTALISKLLHQHKLFLLKDRMTRRVERVAEKKKSGRKCARLIFGTADFYGLTLLTANEGLIAAIRRQCMHNQHNGNVQETRVVLSRRQGVAARIASSGLPLQYVVHRPRALAERLLNKLPPPNILYVFSGQPNGHEGEQEKANAGSKKERGITTHSEQCEHNQLNEEEKDEDDTEDDENESDDEKESEKSDKER